MQIKVSIVMAIANTDYPVAHYTGNAIGSIKEHTTIPYELIIVDNGSTVELGGVKWSEIADTYIRNETNLGVSKAWNQGIAEARGEYVCIVNSDIQVFEGWIDDLLDSLQYVDMVMAYPMYDNPYARGMEAKIRRQEWSAKRPSEYLKDFHDFSCVLASKKVFDIVGPFNEEIELAYCEDVDYKMRMRKQGIIFKADHRVNIYHVISATSHTLKMQDAIDLNGIMDRNKEYVNKKWEIDEFGVPAFVKNKAYDPRPTELPELKPDVVPTDAPTEESKPVTIPTDPNLSYCVRTKRSGDKVYYVDKGIASWVKNPETLRALGFNFNDVLMIEESEFSKLERGEPLDLREDNMAETVSETPTTNTNPVLGYREMA